MNMQLSISNPNLISAAGDIGISGSINLTLADDVLADLSAHGPVVPTRSYRSPAGLTKRLSTAMISTTQLRQAATRLQRKSILYRSRVGATGPDLVVLRMSFNNVLPIAQHIGKSIRITFINPGGGGAIGPDFNGDGVINGLDLAIWKANNGITSVATVLQGDADGDGDVDGADFLKWQRNVGHAPPWNGAASDASNVPEPTSMAILMLGGSLTLAFGRRRRC